MVSPVGSRRDLAEIPLKNDRAIYFNLLPDWPPASQCSDFRADLFRLRHRKVTISSTGWPRARLICRSNLAPRPAFGKLGTLDCIVARIIARASIGSAAPADHSRPTPIARPDRLAGAGVWDAGAAHAMRQALNRVQPALYPGSQPQPRRRPISQRPLQVIS
jgi:hypothetical protein